MRRGTVFRQYELFVAAATLAAHASAQELGYRQRDVRFLIELFTNWVESTLESDVLRVNNTQVSRYLDDLADEGYARRSLVNSRPRYRLTRTGLIELLGRIVEQPALMQPAHFCFLYYFIVNYRPKIEELIKQEGKKFPLALKLEVESLLEANTFVEQQLVLAERELKKSTSESRTRYREASSRPNCFQRGGRTKKSPMRSSEDFPMSSIASARSASCIARFRRTSAPGSSK